FRAVVESVKVVDGGVEVCGRVFRGFDSIHVVGFGKAVVGMAKGVYSVLDGMVAGGVVISPVEHDPIGPIRVLKGDHPVPGENTIRSSRILLDYVSSEVGVNDLLFVLVSGGGSALFEVPVNGVSINDLAVTTDLLLKSGADIHEINVVRKHLSMVKGGGLLRFCRSRYVVSLVVSDVVGDRLDTIASGPLVSDNTTFADAKNVLVKHGLWHRVPASVREWIEKGLRKEVPETLKPGDPLLDKVFNFIVASNYRSLVAMKDEAARRGYNVLLLTPFLHGEAREVAKVLGSIIWSIVEHGVPVEKPAVVIAGGETTVTVKGSGVGGRNQELCLSLLVDTRSLGGGIVFACMGSDGVDGVSPAAGAIASPDVYWEAINRNIDPEKHLEDNDSYTFFRKLGLVIETGYTGTNVNDFFVAVIGKP
ncbi:MAG TPA: glycerate kinase, partial [Pyrodictium sp.]|nr:glycerate kinase [Pyrodictium sp.]